MRVSSNGNKKQKQCATDGDFYPSLDVAEVPEFELKRAQVDSKLQTNLSVWDGREKHIASEYQFHLFGGRTKTQVLLGTCNNCAAPSMFDMCEVCHKHRKCLRCCVVGCDYKCSYGPWKDYGDRKSVV